jgi:hypothetical protein
MLMDQIKETIGIKENEILRLNDTDGNIIILSDTIPNDTILTVRFI